jgi:RNA polymerase sigma factor (sigma-70 family)
MERQTPLEEWLADPDQVTETQALSRLLLEGLSTEERRLLALRHLHGLTQKEVGRTLGITQPTVHYRERKALASLRQQVAA